MLITVIEQTPDRAMMAIADLGDSPSLWNLTLCQCMAVKLFLAMNIHLIHAVWTSSLYLFNLT